MFVREHKNGRVITGETGIYTRRDPDTVRTADVLFISDERYRQVQSSGYLDVAPELVVEVMSPSNTWSEMHEKLAEYFAIDVQTVWVVDPQLEQVHAYRAVDDVTLYQKADVLPGFELTPAEIFVAETE